MNAEISETIKAKMLAITNILQAIIVGESSDVIKAKIANLHQKGITAEAPYLDHGLTAEHADTFGTIEAVCALCAWMTLLS